MPTLLRITLISVSLALGIAVALGLAMHKPVQTVKAKAAPEATGPSAPVTPPPPAAPVIAPYRDPVAALQETIFQMEQSSQQRQMSMMRAVSMLQGQMLDTQSQAAAARQQPQQPADPQQQAGGQQPPPGGPELDPCPIFGPDPPAGDPQMQPANPAGDPSQPPSAELPPPPLVTQPSQQPNPLAPGDAIASEGDGRLNLNAQNSDLRVVLEQLSQHAGGLNIMASKSVAGVVNANLYNLSVETMLAAILKSTGFVSRREGDIIYVGTPAELLAMDQAQDLIMTRVYRPNYVKAADLQLLFTPLLTPLTGKVTVNAPSEIDIPADHNKTGGNGYAGTDVVIVRDYATVLAQIDQIFAEVDVKPRQVAIEAMILSVSLSDTFKFGIDLGVLRDHNNVKLVSGSPPSNLASISVADGGLKFGFMDASSALFIEALETIGDTNVIAAPRLTCLNKQRAEIQIGQQLGYISTTVTESAATQTVNFLDVGTLLRIRPYIGNDGLIRLEVHPELSTGSVEIQQGLSLPQKQLTQVTTNVLCPDGATVVIGGLIREDLTTNTSQLPVFGSLPWVGVLFRNKKETIDRNEIIVLITPRIVSEPFMCQEGQKMGNEYTQRQNVYFDKMSPLGRRNMALHHLRMSRAAYSAGDYIVAMKQVNLAIHYDPMSIDAVTLRNEICAAGGFDDESIHQYLHRGLQPFSGRHRDYSRQGFPWQDGPQFGNDHPSSTPDRGITGYNRDVLRPLPTPHGAFQVTPQPAVGEQLPPPAPKLMPLPPAVVNPPPGTLQPPGGPER